MRENLYSQSNNIGSIEMNGQNIQNHVRRLVGDLADGIAIFFRLFLVSTNHVTIVTIDSIPIFFDCFIKRLFYCFIDFRNESGNYYKI